MLVVGRDRPSADRLSLALEHHSYRVTVLLDGPSAFGSATAWGEPSWMRARDRTVPVVMFAGGPDDVLAAVTGAAAARQRLAVEPEGAPGSP